MGRAWVERRDVFCLQRAGDRGGGTREEGAPVPVKRRLSAHKAA